MITEKMLEDAESAGELYALAMELIKERNLAVAQIDKPMAGDGGAESLFSVLTRKTLEECRSALRNHGKEFLIKLCLNTWYNEFCGRVADSCEDKKRKALPYHGWYWRHIDFAGKRIPIGKGCGLVGFMASNKWGHAERDLTLDEADRVILLLEAAMRADEAGDINNIPKVRGEKLQALWDFMQTLSV